LNRYDALSKVWETKANKRRAMDYTRKALDVFTTCFGPDFQTTREQSSRLEKLESMAD
jgi:hypothetical protein